MQRRDALAILVSAAVALPFDGKAQQKSTAVVGYLHPASRAPSVAAFSQGLSEAGYVEGQNLVIEYRFAEGHYDRLATLAADLVDRKVDLIAAIGNAALAAKSTTATIPIVFMGVADPVAQGLVASLARPGGNLTGFSNLVGELMAKRFELLCELVPQAKVIALLVNPNLMPGTRNLEAVQGAASAKGVQLPVLNAGTEGEIDAAFAFVAELRADALLVWGDAFFASRPAQFVARASSHGVPAIYAWPPFVRAGGLISYGVDNNDVWRRAGIHAGRILKGVKPADLPVQQPTKFDLVVNLNTAKALGLTVPASVLSRANEVIE